MFMTYVLNKINLLEWALILLGFFLVLFDPKIIVRLLLKMFYSKVGIYYILNTIILYIVARNLSGNKLHRNKLHMGINYI